MKNDSNLPPMIDAVDLMNKHLDMNTGRPKATPLADIKGFRRVPLIVEHEGYFGLLIYDNNNDYPIEYSRFNTAAKVLGWLYHLSKKANFTTEHAIQMIELAERRGVKVNHDA